MTTLATINNGDTGLSVRTKLNNLIGGYNNIDPEGSGNLAAAARRIVSASDVVDVFIYDTLKDSDAGAWRYKVGHTSWMNEALGTATRGTRALFPSKALIVARAASVTIYDLDDPDCPMWMVFNAVSFGRAIPTTPSTCLTMHGGLLYVGIGTFAFGVADFIADDSYHIRTTGVFGNNQPGEIANRNIAGTGFTTIRSAPTIVNNTVNDVAATILPGTRPNYSRLGLPNPTIAVATQGGTSVILPDGVVRNSSSTAAVQRVVIDETGLVLVRGGTVERVRPQEFAAASWSGDTYTAASAPAILGTAVVAA